MKHDNAGKSQKEIHCHLPILKKKRNISKLKLFKSISIYHVISSRHGDKNDFKKYFSICNKTKLILI